jgi:hypothetical protein
MTTQSMVIPRQLASLAEDCFDASEGIRELYGRSPGKRFSRGMRVFAVASFIPFPLPVLTIRPGKQMLKLRQNRRPP